MINNTDMALLEKIKTLVEASCPGYHFIYETDRMMNERADDSPFPCVFFEEYTDGRIINRYGWKEQVTVELSFMKLAEFQCDAVVREHIREDMKRNAVIPFLRALERAKIIDPVSEYTLMPEPPRFDANAVSLLLRFNATYRLC